MYHPILRMLNFTCVQRFKTFPDATLVLPQPFLHRLQQKQHVTDLLVDLEKYTILIRFVKMAFKNSSTRYNFRI